MLQPDWWNDWAELVGIVSLMALSIVIFTDVVAFTYGWTSVTRRVRDTWLSWPFGIEITIVVGYIVFEHFVRIFPSRR
jgi:hypothetical protein